MTFFVQNVLSNNKNEFCGVRLNNPTGVIMDLNKKLSKRIFRVIKEPVGETLSAKEVLDIFNSNPKIKDEFTITSINCISISVNPKKTINIINEDEKPFGTYMTIKSSAEYSFSLYYPLNAPNLLKKTSDILYSSDNFIRIKIQTAFNLDKVFLAGIEKDGIVRYAIIPRKKNEFDDILQGCRELTSIFDFRVSEGEIQTHRYEYEKCIFLTFIKDIGIQNSKYPSFFTNGTSLFIEEATGFFYNMGNLSDSLGKEVKGLDPKYMRSNIGYIPTNRLYRLEDGIFYIIHGSSNICNDKEVGYPVLFIDLLEKVNEMPLLNTLKNGEIKFTVQESYRNIISVFRIPVDYTELYIDSETIKTELLKEFSFAKLNDDDPSFLILDAKINMTEKEVWLFVTIQNTI